jgi:sulfur carrier protein
MDIVVNGQPRHVATGVRIAALVSELGFAGKRIAVERNGEIIPRSAHGSVELQPGDRIEIVVAVGGG